MADIYELRNRIEGLQQIESMTYSMQIITISRLKKIIDKTSSIKAAVDDLAFIISYLNDASPLFESSFFKNEARVKGAPIFVTFLSNRGFCGYFNHDMLQKTEGLVKSMGLSPSDQDHIFVGKKSPELKRHKKWQSVDIMMPVKDIYTADEIEALLQLIRAKQKVSADGSIRPVYIIYSQFQSILKQTLITERLFPADRSMIREVPKTDLLYFVEPADPDTGEEFGKQWYYTKLLQAAFDASCSEFSQRFLIMKSAVDNVRTLNDELTLELNKERQRIITQELSEIVGTFKALKSSRS